MPGRKKTSEHWVERIRALTENEGLGAKAIAAILLEEAATLRRDDAPAERTIARVQAEFRSLSGPERAEYRSFRWPQSMLDGSLPWEGSRAALELLGHLRAEHTKTGEPFGWHRPQIRLVRWYLRVSLAVPDLSSATRVNLARHLLAWEILGAREHMQQLEWKLAFAPWRGADAADSYREAEELIQAFNGVARELDKPGDILDDPLDLDASVPDDEWHPGFVFSSANWPPESRLVLEAASEGLGWPPEQAALFVDVMEEHNRICPARVTSNDAARAPGERTSSSPRTR